MINRVSGGVLAVASAAYLATDLFEIVTGRTNLAMLWVTYASFVLVVGALMGLLAGGRLWRETSGVAGVAGVVVYAASFVYFSGVTLVAITLDSTDYGQTASSFGMAYRVSGATMVVGGVLASWGLWRSGDAARWMIVLFLAGNVLSIPIALAGIDPNWQVVANTARNVALIGIGVSSLLGQRKGRPPGWEDGP